MYFCGVRRFFESYKVKKLIRKVKTIQQRVIIKLLTFHYIKWEHLGRQRKRQVFYYVLFSFSIVKTQQYYNNFFDYFVLI